MTATHRETWAAWTDADVRAALAEHEPTVRRTARSLASAARSTRVLDEEDLRAEGRVAVLEALDRYHRDDTTLGTWVRVRVRQRMIDALRRASVWTRGEMRLVRRRDAEPGAADGVARAVTCRRLVSLDDRVADEVDSAEPARALPLDEAIDAQRRRRLRRAVETLPERQRTAVTLTLFEGLRPAEVSRRMGVTQARIVQLHGAAVERVRDAMGRPECRSVAPPGGGRQP